MFLPAHVSSRRFEEIAQADRKGLLTFGPHNGRYRNRQADASGMAGRILIVDGQAGSRLGLRSRLAAAAYEALSAADGATAITLARSECPDAVLLDLDLTGPMPGTEVLRRLRADRRLAQVPLIGLAAPGAADLRIAALQSGADDVLARPVSEPVLLARLRSLMRRPEPLGELAAPEGVWGLAEPPAGFDRPGLVAIVASRAETGMRLRRDLAPLAPHRWTLLSRAAALADGGAQAPDVFVIEGDPEGAEGTLALMADLRSRGAARHAAFVLLRPAQAAAADAVAYDLGVQDVAAADADPRELALRLAAVLRRKAAVDAWRRLVQDQLQMAVRDPLTGLHNRRYALHRLAGMAEAARMDMYGYAVMVIDLDRFKQVNDRHGHAAGDAVLTRVGERLLSGIRAGDLLARHGGEEFLVALPRATLAEAAAVAERLCAALQALPFAVPGGGQVTVTASVGLAMGGGDLPVREVIDRADRALFAAKAGGRNRVRIDAAA
jgi:two-component system cell cycle response regulator